ncbi:cell wall anchor protein [Bacillus cereus]|nr:cell wall anchor protein [Bacillus cereus]PGU64231.1 cell wall anchor protein [Bacillus cereus]
MRKKFLSFTSVYFMIFILMFSFQSHNAFASEFNFAVKTVIPENQIDKKKSYFDLRMKPSQTQTLEMNLRNDTSKDVKINPEIHSAKTNINGRVEYGNNNIKEDSTLPYKIEDLITIEKEIIIPAKGSYTLKLDVKMPDKPFDGILAGGITLQEADEDKAGTNTDQGMEIKNKYAYAVAILLSLNDNPVSPHLVLGDVFPDQVNARNVIKANIRNVKPMYMNKMGVEAKVTKKGYSNVLYELKKDGMQMAPNSNFDLPIPLNGDKLVPGEYTLDLTAKSMGETWHWKKNFKIEGEIAKDLNTKDVTVQTDYTWLYIGLGVLFVLCAFLLWFLLWRRKKKKKDDESQEGKVTGSDS